MLKWLLGLHQYDLVAFTGNVIEREGSRGGEPEANRCAHSSACLGSVVRVDSDWRMGVLPTSVLNPTRSLWYAPEPQKSLRGDLIISLYS